MFWQDKRVLITGIKGFLGRNLEKSLSEKGTLVFGFGRKNHATEVQDQENNFHRFISGDIANETSISEGISTSEPDVIFHLAAQSSVAASFQHPSQTCQTNCLGTSNLLEAVCKSKIDPVIIFAGSSDEYGLVFSTPEQYESYKQENGEPDNLPSKIPEIPISETNPLRPLSPYAISKVYGDLMMRNYHRTQGMKTIVCRSFNVEGAGRGDQFVTSVISKQVSELDHKPNNNISIGNINPIRDFSHVDDIVNGYQLLAESGHRGNVYNLGSMRGVSIATYLLTCLEAIGNPIEKITIGKNENILHDPLNEETTSIFGSPLKMSRLDKSLIQKEVSFSPSDIGFVAFAGKDKYVIEFDPNKFRPADIPILIADTSKISKLGYKPIFSHKDIIEDQLKFYRCTHN